MIKYHLLYLLPIFFLTLFAIFSAYMLISIPRTHIEVQYDCRLAEISPDYPQAVKQKCRELMK